MEHQPFFSIIIPTYNRSGHLNKAVTSIFAQSRIDFEVIVVDDGSTDNTKAIMLDYQRKDQRIRYFFKVNEERSIARNYGISKSLGKYVCFLDSDDILYSNHFEVAYDLLKRNSFPEVGHLGFKLVDELHNVISVRDNLDESFKSKLIYENILHGNAIFVRRDIANEINFIPSPFAILSEDWYLWLRLAARYPFCFDNTITSAVVQHDERSLMKIDPDKLIASTNIIVEYLKRDKPFLKEYKGKTSSHFANHYTFLSLILALTKSRRYDTIKYLMTSVGYDPMVIFRKRFLASIKHWF
jgi:glycosyltransferase involved in cell wall biosynthesis